MTILTNNDYNEIIESQLVKESLENFYSYPNDLMWSKYENIRINNPFIFFHQRKSGGTSIRSGLYKASLHNNLTNFILCTTPKVPCAHTHFPLIRGSKYHVYAGHFKWNYIEDFNLYHSNKFQFTCTTNFREPISRLKSCLYYRFNNEIIHLTIKTQQKIACLQNIKMKDLEKLMNSIDMYGTSCLDEPFRILSGFYDPDYLLYDPHITYDKYDLMYALKKTFTHITKCAPLVLELPDSYQLIANKFPQLANAFNHSIILNNNTINNCDSLSYSIEQQQLFDNYTILERFLYDAVYKKVSTYIDSWKESRISNT